VAESRFEPLVFVEDAHEVWDLLCPTAPPVPRSQQISREVPKPATTRRAPRVAPEPRYCLSFTAAGLRPELAAVIAGIHLEGEGDWARTKAAVLERNALQARSASSGKRLESELRQRLENLTHPQLELLAKGTGDDRNAMAWLAVLKRIQIAFALVRDVLENKLSGLDLVLRRSDMASFYEASEREHPELAALAPSSQQKIRSTLLQMLRDADLLAGKAGKGGALGTVQRPSLSPQAQQVVADDNPELLEGFLISRPRLRTAKPAPAKKAVKPPAKSPAKPPAKSPAKSAAKPAAKKASPAKGARRPA